MGASKYDPERWLTSEDRAANEESRNRAEHYREEWTHEEDQFLVDEWMSVPRDQRDEATIAEILGRTIVACRVRASHIANGTARSVTRRTRTVRTTVETTVTESSESRPSRPAWMDEEGLPEWYV